MKHAFVLCLFVAGCGASPSPKAVSIAPAVPTPTGSAPSPVIAAPATRTIVVTNAPYGGIALWRPHANGLIEPFGFPWAKLSIIDSLTVSPNGREVAYVEGGPGGVVLVRALADGEKTFVAPHVPGHELSVAAWSPNGRKLLYAERTAQEIPGCAPGHSSCVRRGPRAYRVYDRDDAKTTPVDLTLDDFEEIAALLDSGELLVTNDAGALDRFDPRTKTRTLAVGGPYRHSSFSIGHGRLLSTGWDEKAKVTEILALDLATWKETALTTPGGYAEYGWPAASPSGKRVAWIDTTGRRPMTHTLVVDGSVVTNPSSDLVGFEWIDDAAIVAHYRNKLDVVDTHDGSVRGTITTDADDMSR